MNHPTSQARALLTAFLALSPIVFWYGLIEPFEACKSSLAQLTAVALVALGVAAACGQPWRWARVGMCGLFGGPVGLAVLCGVVSAVVSTACSISPRTSIRGALDSSMGLGSVLALAVIFAASRAVCGGGAARGVLRGAVVGLALSCTYGLVQALGYDPVRWAFTWDFGAWARPAGTIGHPNHLAGYAVMALPVVAWQMREAAERQQRGRVIAGGVLAALAGVTVLASLSRAAWVSLAIVAGVLINGWRMHRVRRRGVWVAAGLAAGCAAFIGADGRLGSALLDRVQGLLSSPGRGPIWAGAWRLFLDHPWAGCGLDTFGLAWPGVRTAEYWEVEWGFMPAKAHNDLLHALATQGLPGGIAYLMLPCALAAGLVRAWRHGHRREAIVFAAILLAFYAQNLVGFAAAGTSGLLAVVAGAVAGLGEQKEGSAKVSGSEGRALSLAAWLGVLVLLVSLWRGGAWQEGQRFALLALALAWSAVAAISLGREESPFARRKDALSPSERRLSIRPGVGPSPPAPGRTAWSERRGATALVAAVVIATFWYIFYPLYADTLSFRAEEWLARDVDTALSFHDRAASLDPSRALLHERRARACCQAAQQEPDLAVRRRRLRASRDAIVTACELEPLSAAMHATRGRILVKLAREDMSGAEEVLAAFDRALALDKYDWLALADAAVAAASLGRFEACERYLEAGLREQPRLGVLLAARGALQLARGQHGEAESTLREALAAEWFGEMERLGWARRMLALAADRHDASAIFLGGTFPAW